MSDTVGDVDPVRSAHAAVFEFEAAWDDFKQACATTVAPEATYQAWLAHFVIKRLDLLRVVREVDFGARHLGPVAAQHFTGHNLMVDLLILREPVVNLPRRAALARKTLPDGTPNPRSGLARLTDFSVIDAAEAQYPDRPLPAAGQGASRVVSYFSSFTSGRRPAS